ncbi:CoA transferase [Rouxiella silvae]|uniref:CoA transferase n=1 Tax=Rouxiella silvae TaxID=1646373 RepID=A0AA40X2U0_9GAMM|nr:CoA transferase [Rouxiella silvae]MBF6637668.1 CoA transferase [Rouxiella silvae]ORJ20362.1 CoA transferase [Rouxiella silvae]
MTTHNASRPLQGVKVLDLSRVLAGPYCASLLNDLGAEVTKIEMPETGDDSRAFTPHLNGESTYFMLLNHGKKSLTLNLKSPEGRALLEQLIESADVLVENFRPGVTARLGLDYDAVNKINPKLIYASISGFGQQGPLAHKAAYDHVIQAMGGIMQVTGWANGEPTRVGDAIGDVVSGLYCSWGILAALLQRGKTGLGQHVDVAMLDAMVSMQMVSLTQLLGGMPLAGRLGNSHPISAPMDSYRAADGYLVIAVANDSLFRRLADSIGKPELTQDARFATDPQRLKHQYELRVLIEAWLHDKSIVEALALLDQFGIPAAPVWGLDEVLKSPHVVERGLLHQVIHPVAGEVTILPQPVKMSGMTELPDLMPPRLGEHTREILGERLGLSTAEMDKLQQQGVI